NTPGVYKSTNDGSNWTSITPNSFPSQHSRSVVTIAPSNTSTCFVLTYTGNMVNDTYEDIRLHKINISNGASEDRTANLPVFTFFDGDQRLDSQRGYNLTLAIKPDNENFVMIAGTCLFRSTNGFSTKPNNQKLDWIGGYNPIYFGYPNFHPDIHAFAFDPTNPKAMWWGHDGGLTYTSDITNSNYAEVFPWEKKNNGYNVTQFYMVTQPKGAGDNRIIGGTQDNGSPFFIFDGNSTSASEDVSSGDGSYGYLGDSFCYTSSQEGAVLRVNYDGSGNASRDNGWSHITPKDAKNQSFINPYVIDPNNEDIMLYPAGNTLWRNNQLSTLPVNPSFAEGITEGWTELTSVAAPDGFIITALAVSESNPQHRLYYGASNFSQTSQAPKVFRLDNANTATNGAVELTIAGVADNSYIHNIAINPDNADEILVVMSNYNITGIFHSSNGGNTFTAVEGSLTGDETNPGPSIRAASILPTKNGTLFLVATSTGVYSTTQLNGNNTNWFLEGANSIGNVIVNYLSSRKSDGRVVAGTHGRGAFVGQAEVGGAAVADVNVSSLTLQSKPGETGNTSFILSNTGEAPLNFNISVSGSFNSALSKANETKYTLNRADLSSTKFDEFRNKSKIAKFKTEPKIVKVSENNHNNSPLNLEGNDFLFLDDGDNTSDDFIGWGDGSAFDWYNEFTVSGNSFEMDSFHFFLRTEQAVSNDIYASIYDQDFNLLSEGTLSLSLAPTGDWFTISLNPKLSFAAGAKFYIELYSYSFIPYPAGADTDANIPNKGFYFNGLDYVGLNTISGYENAAFIIRASGTFGGGGGGNTNPVAVANLSKDQAGVNESISFDASQSFDTDGQITQYLWNFGDGSTSAQQMATHSYSQADTYTYSLTVTDNQGATDQKTGQITISGASNNYVIVEPSNGTIQPGASQSIKLTLNAQTLNEGNYTGQLTISTNGGNINIPIDYLVDVKQISSVPQEFRLDQNYPNPFNPSTTIS
ncbi:MAG: PKD domain-containing protein, partial [Ignavibacteriae bacterium]|nr:PKD domain-containing protein [Ignavibacteriota bacterium]